MRPALYSEPDIQPVSFLTMRPRLAVIATLALCAASVSVPASAQTSARPAAQPAVTPDQAEQVREQDADDRVAAADVPAAVAEALRRTHASATDVRWNLEDGGFEASFTEDMTAVSVVLSADGAVRETETELHVDAVPVAVQNALARGYAGFPIGEFSRVVTAGGRTTYEIEVRRDGRTTDVVFDASGAVVSAEQD